MSIGNIILIIAAAIAGLIIVGGATYFLIFRMFFKSFGKSLSTVKRHWKDYYNPIAGGIPVRMIALILSGGIRND